MSEASCPNFEPRAHARLTGLTNWPGEWHSPVFLKLTTEGVRRCSHTAGSWSKHLQPHGSGSTVGGGSPRYRTVSLFPFLRTCIAAGLTGDARPRFFESYALLEEQVRRARSDDGRL